MPKFVILGNPMGGFLASATAAGAFVRYIENPFLRMIMRAHCSDKINRVISLPLKWIWGRICMSGIPVSEDDDIYFIFCEGFKMSYSEKFLKYLRRKYRNSKLIHYFRNPLVAVHAPMAKLWDKLKYLYDAGITFNKSDADKLGLLYTDYWPCLLPEKHYQPENASDVFFIGQAKDRLAQILAVYERLTDAGLKCDFWITGVTEDKQKYSDVIHYKTKSSYTWMSYSEILQRDKNTKCVLELLPYGQNYSSLRPCEALWYHKKLLTTNLNAPSEWFYNPEIVQVFSNASEIDTDFIKKTLTPENEHRIFDGMNIGDFNIFADFVIRNVHRKES